MSSMIGSKRKFENKLEICAIEKPQKTWIFKSDFLPGNPSPLGELFCYLK